MFDLDELMGFKSAMDFLGDVLGQPFLCNYDQGRVRDYRSEAFFSALLRLIGLPCRSAESDFSNSLPLRIPGFQLTIRTWQDQRAVNSG